MYFKDFFYMIFTIFKKSKKIILKKIKQKIFISISKDNQKFQKQDGYAYNNSH
jgi:hypothetical protein